jgi:hypothetical protein
MFSILESFIDLLFSLCVNVMIVLGHFLGISYQAVNIYIFCILGPIVFLLMLRKIIIQKRIINELKNPKN